MTPDLSYDRKGARGESCENNKWDQEKKQNAVLRAIDRGGVGGGEVPSYHAWAYRGGHLERSGAVKLLAVVIKRQASAQQHEHDHPQRPHVNLLVVGLALEHLRREVSLASAKRPSSRAGTPAGGDGDARPTKNHVDGRGGEEFG